MSDVNAGELAALQRMYAKNRGLAVALGVVETVPGLAPIVLTHNDPSSRLAPDSGEAREIGWGPSFEADASLIFEERS